MRLPSWHSLVFSPYISSSLSASSLGVSFQIVHISEYLRSFSSSPSLSLSLYISGEKKSTSNYSSWMVDLFSRSFSLESCQQKRKKIPVKRYNTTASAKRVQPRSYSFIPVPYYIVYIHWYSHSFSLSLLLVITRHRADGENIFGLDSSLRSQHLARSLSVSSFSFLRFSSFSFFREKRTFLKFPYPIV